MQNCLIFGVAPERKEPFFIRGGILQEPQRLVCMGMADYKTAEVLFEDTVMGRRALAFLWRGAV